MFFGLWVIYYALHSLLAANAVKSKVPLPAQAYRFLYSGFAGLGLLFVLFFGASLESTYMILPSAVTEYVGLIMTAIGVLVIKRGFRKYSFREFMGIKKEETGTLQTDGLQAYIRHPLYTGTILLVMGYVIFNPLLVNGITLFSLFLYLPFGIHFEEKKLIKQYGQAYLDYKEKVPSLFPNRLRKR